LLEERLAVADLVIYLDLPRWICMFRILKRTVRWWQRLRPGAPVDCVERFDWEFFHYIWTFRRDYRPKVLEKLHRRPATCRLITVKNGDEIPALMGELSALRPDAD
jgi:adenylate kinase family enzyme